MAQQLINQLITQFINPDELLKRYSNVKQKRLPWESKWEIIQRNVFPDYRDYTSRGSFKSEPKTSQIKNHCSAVSGRINKVVSLLNAQLTDPSVDWFNLEFEEFKGSDDVWSWIQGCKKALNDLFSDPDSNFYPSTYSFHLDWFTIGTACREVILRKDNGKIQFNTISMENIFAEQSGYGELDTIFRTFKVTAKQAFDLWGEAIHHSQLQLVQQGSSSMSGMTNTFEYVEVAMKNPAMDKIPMEYITVVLDKTNKNIVDIGLHHQLPYVIARFLVSPGETYGRSYVWNAMPDICTINRISKRIIQGIDFSVLPVNLVQDATSIITQQITPGAFVQGIDHNGQTTIRPMQTAVNVQMATEFYNIKINELDDALVAAEIFPQTAPNMTATEVNERKIQANNRIRPLLVRLESEDLNKMVKRTLYLLHQAGRLPEFPYEKLQILPEQLPDPLGALRVRFSGQMAKMQKLQDVNNSDILFQKALAAAQVDPNVLDRIDLGAMIKKDAEIYGIDRSIIRDDETFAAIQQSKAEAQAESQKMQQEAMATENLVKLKEAGIDPRVLIKG